MNKITDPILFYTDTQVNTTPDHFTEFFPASVLILNENFVIINANKFAQRLIGNEKELIGKNVIELISGNTTDEFIDLLNKSFTTSKPYSTEIRIKTTDNRYIESLAMFGSFNDSETNKKFCLLAIHDLTNQKMKEIIIKDSESRFKEMANTAPVMIWIADIEGLFSFVNRVWLEYSGGELGNQLGLNWLNQVHPEDVNNLLNIYRTSNNGKKSFSVEFRLKNKSDEFQWMLLKGKPRFGRENIYLGFIGSCINIQEQKEIEDKISKLNEELLQTIKTRDRFFSIISHDLRSPLSGLMGILDILNTSFETMADSEKKEIISDATIVSKTTYTLLENLLEWSRIQTGTIYYNPENLSIHRLAENISSLYAQNMKDKNIIFYNDTKPDHLAFADRSMAETILRNLISNAIKFSYKGGSIIISSKVENEMLIIEVNDKGVGMNDDKIKNLFKGEATVSSNGTEKESGTGLGLIICKEFVEKHSGEIWVESKKNEGSTFYFSIPLAK